MPDRLRAAAKGAVGSLYVYDDIGGDMFGEGITAKDVAEAMKALGNASEINIYINSYGGSVFQGLAIFNILRRQPARITTHVDGIAASAASVIAMAGDEIRMAANGFLMIHNAWGIAAGDGDALRRAAKDVDLATESIAQTYASRRNGDIERIREWMAAETWFNAEQAVKAGLVDGIVDENRIAAFARPAARFPFRHVPESLCNAAEPEKVPEPLEEAAPAHTPIATPQFEKRAANLAALAMTAKGIRQRSAPE